MTGVERIRAALRFRPSDRIPAVPLLGAHAVHLAGISYEVACAEAAAQADALLRAVDRYQPDAVFTLMDLSAEPEALGAGVTSPPDHTPVVTRHLSPDALLTEAVETMILTARVPVFLDTVRRLRAALGDSRLVGALISGPLTAVANAVGIETLARMLRRERTTVQALLARLTRACCILADAHLEAGAHGLVVLEPCATSGLLGPEDFASLLLTPLQNLAEHIHRRSGVGVLHICGDCRVSLPGLAQTHFDALSLDSMVDLTQARRETQDRLALMGNLDVRHLLLRGAPSEVAETTCQLLHDMGPKGGFLLSGGCELPAATPERNIRVMLESVRIAPPTGTPSA